MNQIPKAAKPQTTDSANASHLRVEQSNSRKTDRRFYSDLPMPFFACRGTGRECGEQLGGAWSATLREAAGRYGASNPPWWRDPRFAKLIERLAPHLPDLYRGMADGAGIAEDRVGTRMPVEKGGCTSFAIEPAATLDGIPISGQSKDVSVNRGHELIVLRLELADAPPALTLTYPGWLFGHGFVRGGVSIYRNSLYLDSRESGIPYAIWGILALHCPSVEDVMRLTRDHGIDQCAHLTVADEQGGIVGIEYGGGKANFLEPRRGIYAHANAICSGDHDMLAMERVDRDFLRPDSINRTARMYAQLDPEHGRITPQICYRAMADHDGYPRSICRHQSERAVSAAVVIGEPTLGRLTVTRGLPCQAWPKTYRLG